MSKIIIRQLRNGKGCPEENSLVKANDKYYVVTQWANGHTNFSIEVRQSDKNGNITNEKVIYSTICLMAFTSHPLLPDINSLPKKRTLYSEMDVFYEVCENLEKYLK